MKAKPISLGLLLLFLFLIAATPSWASPVVLSPISADNGGVHVGDRWTTTNTIDQSGLAKKFESGRTPWNDYFVTVEERELGRWTSLNGVADHSSHFNDEWFSPSGILESSITYDLGRTFRIDKIALWNEESYGISRFEIWFEDQDSGSGKIYWGELEPGQYGSGSAYPAEIFDLDAFWGDFEASHVYLDVFGFSGDKYVSMGEIAFSATHAPAPPAVFLLFSGLLGLASYRRFNR